MAPRLEPSRDTRHDIVIAARDLLIEEGLSGLSMRKVALACDLSATALYRHFDDKDGLICAAVQEGARLFASYLMTALRQAHSPRARLRLMGQRYFDFALEHPRDYELLFMVNSRALELPKLDEKAQEECSAGFRLLVDRVVECQRSGDVRPGDPELWAASIWASVHGVASLVTSGHLRVPPDALREIQCVHLDAILRGVAPDHPSAESHHRAP